MSDTPSATDTFRDMLIRSLNDQNRHEDDVAAHLLRQEVERKHCAICKQPIRGGHCWCV